jgi:V/A-type H+-transporting ATPase subunit B
MNETREKLCLYRVGSRGIRGVTGPLLFVEGMEGAANGDWVTIETGTETRDGQVVEVRNGLCAVLAFDGTMGLEIGRATVWRTRGGAGIRVGEGLRGQILDGRGRPAGGKSLCQAGECFPLDGRPITAADRLPPGDAVETGFSVLDVMVPLALGQTVLLLAEPGLPLSEFAAKIAVESFIPAKERAFFVVFAAIGLLARETDAFMDAFERSGVADGGVFLLNRAGDPLEERFLTPRAALAIAEYFAFTKGYDVLVVMADMFRYAEALREIGAARGEAVCGGYPLSIRSELAGLYGRSGRVFGSAGSVTQLVAITLPGGDLTHTISAISKALAEGWIALDRGLHARGVFPPVDVGASLSRFMDGGIGRGRTFHAHRAIADQLCAARARAEEIRRMPGGEFPDVERRYVTFGEAFEKRFIAQNNSETFTFAQSEARAWEILRELPAGEMNFLPQDLLERKLSL